MIWLLLFLLDYWEAVSKLRNMDVNAVSGTLKLYFRELPEPLIPTDHFQSLSKALGEVMFSRSYVFFSLTRTHTLYNFSQNDFAFYLYLITYILCLLI